MATHLMICAVADLSVGDLVDLEGDPYADPGKDSMSPFIYEYERVDNVERETADCIRIDFNSTSIGFPPNHLLRVVRGD